MGDILVIHNRDVRARLCLLFFFDCVDGAIVADMDIFDAYAMQGLVETIELH